MERGSNNMECDQLIKVGNAALWHEISAEKRREAIRYAVGKKLIEASSGHLLEWILQNQALSISDEQKINQLIAAMRERLFDTLPAPGIPEPEEGLNLPEIPKCPRVPLLPPVGEAQLDADEIIERFMELGVNIETVFEQWGKFYVDSEYATRISSGGYRIEIPRITVSFMNALEEGLQTGLIDTIMIDDNRLNEGKTLKAFQPSTSHRSRRKFEQVRELSRPFLMDFLDGNIVDFQRRNRTDLLKSEKETIRKARTYEWRGQSPIRIVGVYTGIHQMIAPFRKNTFEEAANLLANDHTTLMSLGTWTRLLHFLRTLDQRAYRRFVDGLAEPQGGGYRSQPEVLLNSFTHDGYYVTARAYAHRKEFLTKASTSAHPLQLDKYTVPLVTIQSDCLPFHEDDIIDAEFFEDEDSDDIPF